MRSNTSRPAGQVDAAFGEQMPGPLVGVDQAVILCGGLGSRLGMLTATTPKPLLLVDGRPFLEILIEEIARQGVSRFLLLAAFESNQIKQFAADLPARLRRPIVVEVSVEPERAGTGGALKHAEPLLDPVFFMFNGDSWFDVRLASLRAQLTAEPERVGVIALRRLREAGRYGTVALNGTTITAFRASGGSAPGQVLVNAGVYLFRKRILRDIGRMASLEQDVLPTLAMAHALAGVSASGYFIDIGVPEDFSRAQVEISMQRRKPALFLDRDGVINLDHGYVGSVDRFDWVDGAREAIAWANKSDYYVFVVTNQAGIGRGYYKIEDFWAIMNHIQSELSCIGGHIDDVRFCPFHPEATVAAYRGISDWRKPAPGMILDLIDKWPVDLKASLLVGDQPSDLEAAAMASVKSLLFKGGRLDDFLRTALG